LAALSHINQAAPAGAMIRLDQLPFLDRREHFLRAGRDADDREIYAVWIMSGGAILTRLIHSFCDLYQIPGDQYTVCQVVIPQAFRLRLAMRAYQLGLFGLARRVLRGLAVLP
jgi:hypothetical protein